MARGGEKHSPTRFCQSPFLRVRALSYRFESRIDSFWARALHKDVFPVPGGPNVDTNIDTQSKSYRFLQISHVYIRIIVDTSIFEAYYIQHIGIIIRYYTLISKLLLYYIIVLYHNIIFIIIFMCQVIKVLLLLPWSRTTRFHEIRLLSTFLSEK